MKKHLVSVGNLNPGQNFDAYLQAIGNINVLDAEQERQLAEQLYHHNDVDAARKLVISHLRFVVHIARSYNGYGLPIADLVQEGNIGLMKAVKRFNPEFGVRLVSFAVHWIKAEIHEFILRNWRMVKIATTKAQRKLFFNLRNAKKRLTWLNNQEVSTIAETLNVEPHTVRQMEERMAGQDTAFDGRDSDDSEKSYTAPAYFLEDTASNPYHQLEQANQEAINHTYLSQGLASLDARSRDIIQKRWLDDTKATLHTLAAEYNVSAERIRQLEKNAMKKLKGLMAQSD